MRSIPPGASHRTRRRWRQAAAVGSVGLSAWGWVRAADAPLRIGFQKSAVNLVILKQQSVLERLFPASKVQWVEFPAGPQLLEALAVGSLEFGLTGDSPPVFAQAAGKDLRYVGAEPPKPLSSALLVKADSPLQRLADLKGRKIALQKGSSAHYLLVRAFEKAKLAWPEITPVYLTPADLARRDRRSTTRGRRLLPARPDPEIRARVADIVWQPLPLTRAIT